MSTNQDRDSEGGSAGSQDVRPTVFIRITSEGRRRAAAVSDSLATSAANAFTATKDGLDSFRYNARKTAARMDDWAAAGAIGRAFRFKERSTKLTTELRAGLITFLMVSYVLVVNPSILATTGGTCDPATVCTAADYDLLGRQCLANPEDPNAVECMTSLAKSLITATAASSLISTFFIGYFGNLPLALAPGIGITAYVAYQVVGQFGGGQLSFQQVMTAVFVEGFIFVILSVTGVRGGVIKYMPKSIAMASSVGIGMLLAFTGLRNLGLIVFDSATLLTLGGCPSNRRNYLYAFDQPITADSLANLTFSSVPPPATVYGCLEDSMRSPTMWLGVSGGFLMCILLYMGVKGSLTYGIIFITIVSWIPGHAASYLGASSPIPGGEQRLEFFRQVVAAPTLGATGLKWDWTAFGDGRLWLALLTFLYIDLLDCTGTLLSMARLLDFNMPGFLSDSMEFPGQMWAFLSDGIGIISGSMMGTTSLTVYIESAAGIEDGGRTGLTAVVVSFFFFASLFFAPIIASIPPYATGPALVLVGTILLGHIAHIEWDDIGVAIPAFLTMVLMPFTYSVAYGVIAGLASYVAIHAPFWLFDALHKRWRRAPSPTSPRSSRAHRRSKTGYHMRKMFGPNDDPPSRADSFAGGLWREDSYHTQDSRRSALPVSAPLPHGGSGGGAAASVPSSIYPPGRSAPASVVNLFFPEGSVRGGGAPTNGRANTTGYVRSGSYGATAESELVSLPQGNGGPLSLFRKSYSMHSPARATEPAQAPRASLAHPRAFHRSLSDMHGGASPNSPPPALLGHGSPARPRPRAGLPRHLSSGAASDDSHAHDGRSPPPARLGMPRSRTFSHGISTLGQGDELQLKHTASDHGGGLFKLFPDAPDLSSPDSSGGFRLFGDVEPLPLDGDGVPAHGFRLFGEIEPLELECEGSEAANGDSPSFRIPSPLAHGDRADTADLSFGGSPPKQQESAGMMSAANGMAQGAGSGTLEITQRGSSAYSELLLSARASAEASGGTGQAEAARAAAAAAATAGMPQEEPPLSPAPTLALLPAASDALAPALSESQRGGVSAAGGSDGHAQQRGGALSAGGGHPQQQSGAQDADGEQQQQQRGSLDEDQVYRKLMRTLSSRSLRRSAAGSDAGPDGAASTAASATSSMYAGMARGSLRSGSLAAAARQLSEAYGRSGSQPLGSSDDGDGELATANTQHNQPQGQPGTPPMGALVRPSPFEAQDGAGGVKPRAFTPRREGWERAQPAARSSAHLRGAVSSALSGLPPDEHVVE